LGITGEGPEYFAVYKRRVLERLKLNNAEPCIDYGCGVGSVTAELVHLYPEVLGYDPSTRSIEVARRRAPSARFSTETSDLPLDYFGTAILSGVLHHVTASERAVALAIVRRTLRPGGKLVLFEHNPLNPLTRRAVATCPFDEEAELLKLSEVCALLVDAGFEVERSDYIVFFPRFLSALRGLEPHLGWCRLGAQTLTVASKSNLGLGA
jgi:SAM-dependent methyltransferase